MKRTREAGLTREQLEAGEYGSEADEADQNGMNKASAAVLGERKIVKVKRHIQATGEVKTDVPGKPTQFKLVGALSKGPAATTSTANAEKPTFQFNANSAKPADEKPNAASESKNLFGENGTKKFAVANGGTFGGVKVGENKSNSLFGSGVKSGADSAAKEPMFKPTSGGLFGGKKLPEQPPKAEETSSSLFGGVKPA